MPRRAIIEDHLDYLNLVAIDESICPERSCEDTPECSSLKSLSDFEVDSGEESVSIDLMLQSDDTPRLLSSPYEHFSAWFHNEEGYNEVDKIMMVRIRSSDALSYEYHKYFHSWALL